MAPGKFITFEGGEGSGKSTQARLLMQRLAARGIEVVATREPGGSPFAEAIRAVLLAGNLPAHGPLPEALLFCAARADHLETAIRPALAAGRWVICDRFSDSTRVYQGTAGGLEPSVLDALEGLVVAPTRPEVTFILDLPAAAGLARASARRGAAVAGQAIADPYERRDLDFHERLRAGYRALADTEPDRCILIDGAAALDTIAADIWAHVERRLLTGQP